MTYSLTWLPEVLLNAGLKVAEVDGWQTRGRADIGRVLGVLCHHTAGPSTGNMPSLGVLVRGRPDLSGPLAQLGLGRDGTYYVIAAGRANHAGAGLWLGVARGNQHMIGIEAENTGHANDAWPSIQLDAYQRGVAAILKYTGLSAERCAGHKEYALPHGRKPDPSLDMPAFRARVAELMRSTNAPELIPNAENNGAGSVSGRPTLRRGSTDRHVAILLRSFQLPEHGGFDARLEATIREFQRKHGLVPDGIVGPKTWAALDVRAHAA